MHRLFITICISFCFCLTSQGQSEAIKNFLEENGEGRKYFVYQSVIRVLNIDGNADFNQLIRNVRRIVVHQPNMREDSTGWSLHSLDLLKQNLLDENFEELIQAKEKTMRLTFLSRGEFENAEFVLLIREAEKTYLAEVEGTLNMAYIGALANARISELTDYLN
jgi:hypothetical protein